MTKILYFNATSEIGGADIDLLQICSNLDKSRFTPIVVLPFYGPLCTEYNALNIEVVFSDSAPIKKQRDKVQYLKYPFQFLRAVIKSFFVIRFHNPEIVHINSSTIPAVAFAARLAGTQIVWHIREIEVINRMKLVKFFLMACFKYLPDKIIAISSSVINEVGLTSYSNVTLIYNCVDTSKFYPNPKREVFRKKNNIPDSAYVIGYVGRLAPIKGLEYLIKSFSIINKLRSDEYLLIIGPILSYKKYVDSLHRLIRKLNLTEHVCFLNDCTDVVAAINSLDILVLPTIVSEALGLVILEALSCGKPVIATNIGGPKEILSCCDAGLLVPPKDSRAIVQAILKFRDLSENDRQRISEKARSWVIDRFEMKLAINQLILVYDSLSKKSQSC